MSGPVHQVAYGRNCVVNPAAVMVHEGVLPVNVQTMVAYLNQSIASENLSVFSSQLALTLEE